MEKEYVMQVAQIIKEQLVTLTPMTVWKIQCKLPPKTKRFSPLVLK